MLDDNSQIVNAFSAASQELAEGRSVETILAERPHEAEQMGAMLRLTSAMRSVSHPRAF